jgi:hypothetical protein
MLPEVSSVLPRILATNSPISSVGASRVFALLGRDLLGHVQHGAGLRAQEVGDENDHDSTYA